VFSFTSFSFCRHRSWGVSGVDRTGTSKYNATVRGRTVLDPTFDLKPAAAQRHIFETCNSLKDNTELVTQVTSGDEAPVQCWAIDFKEWRRQVNKTGDFEDYATDAALISDLKKFFSFESTSSTGSSSPVKPYFKYADKGRLGFSTGISARVVYSLATFNTDVRNGEPYKIMNPFYEKWVAALVAANTRGPAFVNKAFPVAGEAFTFMMTSRKLVSNAKSGVAIMVAVAFGALILCTMNVAIAVLATVAIVGVVANVLALVSLMGWELGLTVSIGIIVAVGLSFDFSAHIAAAYVESEAEDRYERTRDALTDLGISVLFGAMSTVGSGIFLLFATITFFVS
jgi:Patched family